MIEIKNDRDDHAVFIEILSLADPSPLHSVVVPFKEKTAHSSVIHFRNHDCGEQIFEMMPLGISSVDHG